MRSIPVASTRHSARVLVIEDDRFNRSVLKAIFEAAGYRVMLADSGFAGLDALAAASVDIVVLDLGGPGLEGLQTLRRMRVVRREIPVLVITSCHDLGLATEAISCGADDFITRPIENDELVLRVAMSLRHRKIAGELEILSSSFTSDGLSH
jgi:DNA-binding response OmpR family regulator